MRVGSDFAPAPMDEKTCAIRERQEVVVRHGTGAWHTDLDPVIVTILE